MEDAAEAQLLESARGGDLVAFERLVAPLIEPGCHLAYTILRDWHEAEDAVQEAALKAWRAAGKLRRGTATIRPWFLTIIANEARSRRRSRWWSVVRIAEVDVGGSDAGVEDEVLLSTDLERAMRRLNDTERLILFLHFHLDLPLDEVARVTGLSRVVVKARMYRATRRPNGPTLTTPGPGTAGAGRRSVPPPLRRLAAARSPRTTRLDERSFCSGAARAGGL